MLVIAQHNISNPESFWATAKELTSQLPYTLKLHSVYPSDDMKSGVCLWEAQSTQEVQKFLDDHMGNFAKNNCYKINTTAAIGLPEVKGNVQFIN